MSDLQIQREYNVTPERLFQAIVSKADVVQWWGHDGWTLQDAQLDFSRNGPWHSVLISQEGKRYKMSGQVTKIVPNQTIAFTWGWHDPQDVRGVESHVTFTIKETAKGARLIIDHRALTTDESAAQHATGWQPMLQRLGRFLQN